MFALPEACLYADLVQHFESGKQLSDQTNPLSESAGKQLQQDSLIHSYDMDLSYKNLFQDVREVIGKSEVISSLVPHFRSFSFLPLILLHPARLHPQRCGAEKKSGYGLA